MPSSYCGGQCTRAPFVDVCITTLLSYLYSWWRFFLLLIGFLAVRPNSSFAVELRADSWRYYYSVGERERTRVCVCVFVHESDVH